jgi:hypothetical protein
MLDLVTHNYLATDIMIVSQLEKYSISTTCSIMKFKQKTPDHQYTHKIHVRASIPRFTSDLSQGMPECSITHVCIIHKLQLSICMQNSRC